jgi:two-component system sensor histidine kinase YesM
MPRQMLHNLFVKTFLNISLRSKLFVVFGMVAILPLLFFVYYSYHSIKEELTRQIFTNVTATTAQLNANFENKLDAYSKVSASLYLDNRMRDFLTRDYTDSTDYVDAYEYFNNTMNNILTTNPDIRSVSIYTANTTFPADNVFIKRIDENVKKSGWYADVRQSYGNTIFTISSDGDGTSPVFMMARLLNNNSLNYPYGILTFEIAEADIYALMDKENNNKELFIVTPGGTILSCRDKRLLNKNIHDLIRGDFGRQNSGSFDSHYRNEKVLVIYNTINNGWKTVSVVPYKGFMKNAQIAATRTLLIALISAVLAVLLIYITSRLFTKRIEFLLHVIRRLEREDFNIQTKFMGHDEIGQLSFAFMKMAERLKGLINEVYKREISKKEAEMNMLQAQINPHFLYNTLASISSLAIKHGDQRIYEMVTHLAKFYRISLNKGKNIITINEELKLTEYYIAIQQHRFQGMLHLHYHIDESVLVYQTVKLTLQPFVENAINHAIWDDESGINIIIKAYKDEQTIFLEVIDDGMGMPPEKLEEALSKTGNLSGYGIANVDRRIKMSFGEDSGVTIYSKLGMGTKAQIRIPMRGVL